MYYYRRYLTCFFSLEIYFEIFTRLFLITLVYVYTRIIVYSIMYISYYLNCAATNKLPNDSIERSTSTIALCHNTSIVHFVLPTGQKSNGLCTDRHDFKPSTDGGEYNDQCDETIPFLISSLGANHAIMIFWLIIIINESGKMFRHSVWMFVSESRNRNGL